MNQKKLCVDDFGDEVYVCFYTHNYVRASEAQFVGSVMSSVNIKHVMAKSTLAHEVKQMSERLFYENEANCNTCKYLQRVKHKKNKAGFLYGECSNKNSSKSENPYNSFEIDGIMMFHPDDPMLMSCYVPRWGD